MVRLPKFSIATKLYAIFALLATATVVLAAGGRRQRPPSRRADKRVRGCLQGARNVERLNGLIYAVRLESRGIIMSGQC